MSFNVGLKKIWLKGLKFNLRFTKITFMKLVQHITSKEKYDKINGMCFNIIAMAQVLTHG